MMTTDATLHHTSFVVRDIEKAAKALRQSLGIGPWNCWTIAPDECTVRGQDVKYSFKVALAQIGGSSYELIEPDTGESVYVEHLAQRGEGFHHTCIGFATHQAMLSAKARLISEGREMVQTGRMGGIGEFCYFEIAETGSLVELMYLGELPPPEKTIE
jgi:hypothetical protein